MGWVPNQPNVTMTRVQNYDEAVRVGAGAFWWRVQNGREYSSIDKDGKHPTHLAFMDNRGRYHAVPINPVKGNNGAGWDWDGNLDKPTLSPSILSSGNDAKGNKVVHWHGFIRGGVVGFET